MLKIKNALSLLLAATIALSLFAFPSSADERQGESFRILFIGNSYSEDATDGFTYVDGTVEEGYSTFCEMLRAVLGAQCKIEIGLLLSGGKSLTWHCYRAETEEEAYSFRVVGESTGYRWREIADVKTTKRALTYDDWDAVVIQPYGPEIERGYSTSVGASMSRYSKLSDSVPYMIDYVGAYAPDADIYFYLIIAKSQKREFFAGSDTFEKIRTHTCEAETYSGLETGKSIKGVVPVGTAIQNARSTYLSLQYSVDPSGVVSYDTDPVTGLQRDELHVSYSVGRYIAALTFVEYLFPDNKPLTDPLSVPIRRPDGAAPLPAEYKATASEAVKEALLSTTREGAERFAPVDLTDHKTDPADLLTERSFSYPVDFYADPESDVCEKLTLVLAEELPAGATILPDASTLSTSGAEGSVKASLTYGYTVREIDVPLRIIDHDHVWYRASAEYYHGGDETCSSRFICTVCGKETQKNAKKEPCPSVSYLDLSGFDDWSHEGVDKCIGAGVMMGVADSLFDPDGLLTRAMLVTSLWRAAGKPVTDAAAPFSDLSDDWYRAAVDWAYGEGLIFGVGNGRFSPDGYVTREQIAAALFRFEGGPEIPAEDGVLSLLDDSGAASPYAYDALAWACSSGIIKGVATGDATVLDPLGNATRAQTAVTLSRYFRF